VTTAATSRATVDVRAVRNNFPLASEPAPTLLIAGGIGGRLILDI
jgi:ferredoxin-NADP reductase